MADQDAASEERQALVSLLIDGCRYGDTEDVCEGGSLSPEKMSSRAHPSRIPPPSQSPTDPNRIVDPPPPPPPSALKSVSPNSVDEYGRDGIHMAAGNSHVEIVKLLVEAGASVGTENAEGSTPLHWACLNGHVKIVEYLLDKGAKLSACNKTGRTPFDEALTRNQKAVLDYLESRHDDDGDDPEGADDLEKDIDGEVEEFKLDAGETEKKA